MSKLRNNSKGRNATANEIAKKIILDKLEIAFYYQDNSDYTNNYTDDFNMEIVRHMEKHINSIHNRLNPNNDNIEMYY